MSKFKTLASLFIHLTEQGVDPDDVAVNSDDVWFKNSDLENEGDDEDDDDDDDDDDN